MKSIKEEVADLEKRIRVIETERERTTRRKQLYVGLADQIRNPSSDACKQVIFMVIWLVKLVQWHLQAGITGCVS